MLLFLLIIGALSFIFIALIHKKHTGKFHPPPGPKGLPLIGILHQFDPSKPHVYFANLAKIYGPILRLQLGRRSFVVIQSAKLAKELFQTQEKNIMCNRMLTVAGQRLSYNGLDVVLAPYNDYYKEVRKLFMVYLLSSKRVQSLAPIRHEEITRLVQKISTLSSSSKVVNLSELLVDFASCSICRMAFGKRYGDDEVSRNKFQGLSIESQALHASFFFSDLFPYFGWLDKLNGNFSRLEKTFKECDEFYQEIIDDHLTSNKPESEKEDVIDILLHLKKEGSLAFDLTMDHMKAMLMDIIVAGTDTSATTEIWAMTELMKNPNAMEKVQREVRNAIGNKGYIVEGDLANLEYFKAVIKETFRLHPATPLLMPRETLEECTIEGYDIQPKTIISINLWAIGRDPEIWNEPELFKPERFLGSSVNFLGQNFELIPFGAGRRICPGMYLGLTGVELVLANLLYFFDWEMPSGLTKEDIDTDAKLGVVMHKKNPLCLVANKFP